MTGYRKDDVRNPTVLIPYAGACTDRLCHDVFVYLRPETNGVEVESTLFRVVRGNQEYREKVRLVYLANIPGSFIRKNRIVEQYYRCQLHFISGGKPSFTPHMRATFEAYFGVPFENAPVVSPFDALNLLSMNYDELFNLRVPLSDMLLINGQSIKKFKGYYVLNYDIPAILHKNNNSTDIAVMMFRIEMEYEAVHRLIDEMGEALVAADILHPEKPLSRIFHYSKGPFDQVRDAQGYLYTKDNQHEPMEVLSFCAYLLEKGFSLAEIKGILNNPIVRSATASGEIAENYLYTSTVNDSFESAAWKFSRIQSQLWCR